MPFLDKEKQREASRRHYERNREAMIAKSHEANKVARLRNKEYVWELKAKTPCADCGVQYPPYVMQFDHIIDEKRGNIADMVRKSLSLETIQTEIDKCEIVCANCHAERTYGTHDELEEDFPHEA